MLLSRPDPEQDRVAAGQAAPSTWNGSRQTWQAPKSRCRHRRREESYRAIADAPHGQIRRRRRRRSPITSPRSVNAADCTVAPDRRRIRLNAAVSRTKRSTSSPPQRELGSSAAGQAVHRQLAGVATTGEPRAGGGEDDSVSTARV
jgi:hypothetical protein